MSGALTSKTLVKYSIQRILLKLKCCVTIGLFSPPFYNQHSTSSTHPKSFHDSPSPVQPSCSHLNMVSLLTPHFYFCSNPFHSPPDTQNAIHKIKIRTSFFWNPMPSSNPFHGLQGLTASGLCFLQTSSPSSLP